jgi:hypothetical protein
VTKKPKQSIAQYQANRKAMQKATEVVQQAIPMPITQDDEDELNFANMLVGILPKLATTSSPCNISSAAIYHLMGKSLRELLSHEVSAPWHSSMSRWKATQKQLCIQ